MKISNLIAVAVASILLTACATTPDSLRKPAQHASFVLNEGVSSVSYRGIGVRCEEGMLPGTYVAEREDADGVYYFGPDRSVWNTAGTVYPKPRLLIGGLYVSKVQQGEFRIFYIFEKSPPTTENINSYMQERIVQSATMPGVTPGVGLGANIAGNIVGGILVNAIIDGAVGGIETYPVIKDEALVGKLKQAISAEAVKKGT